jgi:hypothetical protein
VNTRTIQTLTALSCCLLFAVARAGDAFAQEHKYDPTSAYENLSIQGFTVLVNHRVLAYQQEAAEVLEELETQLKEIARAVPSGPLGALRKVRIWVEWNKREVGEAEFHPSAGWLEKNGYNPDKVGAVEISNSRRFVKASRAEQPCLVLHELAHAYHFLVLGERHPGIAAAYKQAVESKSYEQVEHVRGGNRRAYALLNEKEYFAELSEAYFGRNDFYPFTRTDLETHDPVGYGLLQQLWSKLPDH